LDRVRNYLMQALEMTKSCVVVMKYTQNEPVSRTKLEFISENVTQLGMNLASLKGGFRLPKDYIHPEDRDGFIDAVSIAAETHTDFTYRVRLVGDDGVVRNVDIRSHYMDFDEDYYLLEYVFQEIVQQDDTELKASIRSGSVNIRLSKEIFREEELVELFGSFANAYGLYSTVVDQDGHALCDPVGPEAYIGYYYDMFERPEIQEFFDSIKRSTMIQDEAVYMELEGDGNPESRLSAVPIVVNGVYLATWILCAHDKSQTAALRIASREQYHVGELISSFIQRAIVSEQSGEYGQELEKQLDFEIRQKQVLAELQDVMREDSDDRLHQILSKAAEVLEVDYAFYTLNNAGAAGIEKDSWSPDGQAHHADLQMENFYEQFSEEERNRILTEGYVVDQESMTNRIRVSVFQGLARAAMVMPVKSGKTLRGRVCFIESRKERIWTDSEVHFARLIGRMLAETVEIMKDAGTKRTTAQTLLDIFHNLTIDVFIREDVNGRVLFANNAMKKHLGMDFTGHDSRRLIPEGRGEFESYPGAIHEKEVPSQGIRNWRRYINELGAIYDVTEIPIEWVDGSAATAVLLRKAGD